MIIILFAFLHKVVSFCLFFFFPSIKSVICYLTLQPSSFYLWCHHKGFHFCCWQQDKYLSIDLLWFKWKNVCFPLYMQHHYGRLRRCFLTTMLIFFFISLFTTSFSFNSLLSLHSHALYSWDFANMWSLTMSAIFDIYNNPDVSNEWRTC